MKIEELWKKHNAAQASQAKRAEEIQAQEKTLAELKKKQEEAAAAGDFSAYEAAGEEIQKAEGRLYVLIKSAKAGIVTPEEAAACWREFADGYRKEQEKRRAEYRKAQKQACTQYEEMIDKQNAAFHLREDLATMTGQFYGNEEGYSEIEQRYPLPEMLPGHDMNRAIQSLPEAAYFIGVGLWQKVPAEGTLNSIVRLGRSVGRPDFGHN